MRALHIILVSYAYVIVATGNLSDGDDDDASQRRGNYYSAATSPCMPMVSGRPYESSIDGCQYVLLLFIPFTGMRAENTTISTINDGNTLQIEYAWPSFIFATSFMPAVRSQLNQPVDHKANFMIFEALAIGASSVLCASRFQCLVVIHS
jgi:hypothetical protein